MSESREFTIEKLKEVFNDLFYSCHREFGIRVPMHDFPFMSDEEFKDFIEGAMESDIKVEFFGGTKQYDKMVERMDKLGIKWRDDE